MSPKFFLVLLLLLGLAFLAGYGPSTFRARDLERSLKAAQFELQLANLHRRLGVAAEEAQRNNFASASAAARAFFDGCTSIAQTDAFAGQPRTGNAIASYAAQRDEIMSQLANADPQVRDRLASMYLVMDGVLMRRE